ncbi:MAG TPA: hypothetical protein VEJ44_05715 [Acidimicrobiales bacterium]|nr:hypothetical protein [Acidimicrobiales bacterium]
MAEQGHRTSSSRTDPVVPPVPHLFGAGMRRRLLLPVLPAAALLCCGAALSACASSGPTPSAVASGPACQDVSAVLSDGPDPTADPVGYAQAQILPLGQVHTTDKDLRAAIDALDAAYQQMVSTNGSAAATKVETTASNRLNAFCPGAAP